jgi:Fe-S-cluster-containing dehydrogenase component
VLSQWEGCQVIIWACPYGADCSKFTVQKVKDWEIEEVNILTEKD